MSNSKILIVEDDQYISILLQKRLASFGYDIHGICTRGEDAIEMVKSNLPDLILMDIMLEGEIDGIEAALIIKEKFPVPVIFLTALSNERSVQRAKKAEPYGYLMKPFETKDLKAAIEIALHRSEMEKKIKESEIWFRSTLSSIGDAVIATDNEDKIKFTNVVFEKLGGYSPDECLGKKINEVYETLPDYSTENMIYTSINPNPSEVILKHKIFVTKSKQQIPIEEKISTITDQNGIRIGKVISIRDITNRRKAQLTAFKAKEHYLKFFEQFPVQIWRTNKSGDFDYFNPTWLDFTGRSIDTQIYQGWLEEIHPDDKEKFIEVFNRAFEKRNKFDTEFRLLSRDAEYHWLACVGNPFSDLDGNFSGYVGLCFDINNRILLEEELTKSRDTFDAANKAKSTFISIMSHEIRTPLNGIVGLVDLLAETKLDEEQTEYLDMVMQCSNTLLGLLNNLLNFSKLEDNKVTLEESVFNLKKNIEEILQPYKTQAKRSGVQLSLNVDPKIPEQIIGDEVKLKQIMFNLLSNAVKFTERGTIDINVGIDDSSKKKTAGENNFYLHFLVADTGIGIQEEKLEMIFDSFTQVDNSMTRKFSGSGLGLSIIKKLAEMMKGKIWVESEYGKGSDFHFVCEFKKQG